MKIRKLKDCYIKIDGERWYDGSPRLDDLKKIYKEIIEHNIAPTSLTSIVEVNEDICSFCKLTWETDPQTDEPVCCRKAQEEWTKEHPEVVIK